MSRRQPSGQPLKDTLLRAQKGQPGAENLLFADLYPLIRAKVTRRLSWMPPQEQAEAVQTVLEYMWSDKSWLSGCTADGASEPYLFGTIDHFVSRITRDSNTLKRRNIRVQDDPEIPLEPEWQAGEGEARVVDQLSDREALRAILDWLEKQEEVNQEIFRQRFFEEKPTKDVAEALGMSKDTVDQRFSRLNTALKKHLASLKLMLLLLIFLLSAVLSSLQLMAGEPHGNQKEDRNDTRD